MESGNLTLTVTLRTTTAAESSGSMKVSTGSDRLLCVIAWKPRLPLMFWALLILEGRGQSLVRQDHRCRGLRHTVSPSPPLLLRDMCARNFFSSFRLGSFAADNASSCRTCVCANAVPPAGGAGMAEPRMKQLRGMITCVSFHEANYA